MQAIQKARAKRRFDSNESIIDNQGTLDHKYSKNSKIKIKNIVH